ncbi:MAG: aspartyl protease family protein [Acidimicrobiales bacterium]
MATPLPWLYPYAMESGALRRGREVLRPVVTVSLPGNSGLVEPAWALVDTGAENVLAADWLADFAGIDVDQSEERTLVGIGGHVVEVAFVEVDLVLHAPHDTSEVISWRTDVGFVPNWQAPFPIVAGQTGFLDQFTVTFHRGAAMLGIEEWAVFDQRFRTG